MKNQSLVRSFLLLVALALGASLVPLARVEPATNVPCDTAALVTAIQDAVNAGGSQTLKLAQDCTYTLTQPNFGKNNNNASGLPKIQKVKLTVKGNGATIRRDTNAPPFRILYVDVGSEVKLQNLTISGGRTPDGKPGDGGGDGGGIYNKGNLKLDHVVVTNNTTGKGSNATTPTGGGSGGGSGGGIANFYGELLIDSSTISNNKTGDGGTEGANGSTPYGAGVGGAIVNLQGTMRIFDSTLSGNATGDSTNKTTHGGYGGAIYSVTNMSLSEITNSTLSGNRAGSGGTQGKSGGITGEYVIKNSTLANNVGSKGNSPLAEYRRAIDSIQGVSQLSNTLIANTGNNLNCSIGTVINVANNLDTGTSCGFGSANGSKSNANPNLGPLADNGGPTQTHTFSRPSDAFNKGNNDICNSAPVNGRDQRGTARPQGKNCDIGAFELEVVAPTPTATHTPTQTPSPTPTQPPSGVCAGPSAGRISCWKGENNANDSIGTNHGTPQNGATYAAGKVGQAFHLNGSNQYILTTNATNLNFERTNAFSIGTWIRTTGTTNNVMIATKQVNSGQYHGYGLMITNGEQPACDPSNPAPSGGGQLSAFLDGASNSTCPPDFYVGVRATPKLNDGQWHYVAMTYAATSTAAGINLYVDGALQSSVVMADTLGSHSILNSVPFTIGSRENGGVPFNGDIDEVQVWNRALSAQEIAGLAGVSGGDCAGPSNGRISCWKGENNANDSVGSNNGSAQGGATFAAGKVGQAFSFNGTTGHVLVPDSSTLDVTTQFTMSAWVKPASLMTAPPFPGKGAILSKIGGGGGNNGYQYGLADDNKGLWCQFNAQGEPWPANQVKGNVTGLVPLNTWTHVACTYDHANLTVYVNGSAVGTLAVGPKTVNNTSSNLRISSDDNGNVYFDGLIDEAQVWNRALSAQEIKDVYNGSGGSSCTDKPEKPTLKVPADGSIINTTQPKLKWNQAECATTYNVTIQDSLGQTVAKETGLTKLQYSPLLTAGYTYKWFVQAVNEHGKTKSAAWTFFIQ